MENVSRVTPDEIRNAVFRDGDRDCQTYRACLGFAVAAGNMSLAGAQQALEQLGPKMTADFQPTERLPGSGNPM